MSELNTVARPYAKAAFAYAKEHGEVEQWATRLKNASQVVTDPKIFTFLTNPEVGEEKVFLLIKDILQEKLDEHFLNFLRVLAEARRLCFLPTISHLYEELRLTYNSREEVLITSAQPLTEEQKQQLLDALKTRCKKEIILETKIDKRLLGGAVIHIGDEVIDGSARGKLNRLSQYIKTSMYQNHVKDKL